MQKLRKIKYDLSRKGTVLQGQILTSLLALVLIPWSKNGITQLEEDCKTEVSVPFLTACKLEPGFTSLIVAAFYCAENLNSERNFLQGKVQISVSTGW